MWVLLICTTFVILLLVIIGLIIQDQRRRKNFESRGLKYLGNGSLHLLVNTLKGISFQEDLSAQYKYLKSSGKKVGVSVDFGINSLLVRDTDLIKSILIKDFDHFVDRRPFPTGKSEHLFEKMLFTVNGDRWKELRAKMSPTFTTGKIKRMFKLFDTSGFKFIKFLETQLQNSSNCEIDLTEGYSKFTMDIIASAACGINSEAFNQKEPSLFERMGKGFQFEFGALTVLKIIAMDLLPATISDFFGFSFFRQDIQEFFSGAIKGLIQHRQATGERGDDFVQLMLEARAGTLKTEESELETFEKDALLKENATEKKSTMAADLLDDDGIVANCVVFILAGFDTTQSLLLFCAYALALYPSIQERLRAEIDSILEENNGQFTYDGMNKMTYLDMVINETLRFYPPAASTDRSCTMDYKIEGTDYILKKGEAVTFPIIGIHHDPEFYPEPSKFDPERFSKENRNKMDQYAFLPFGQGPRNCIGMRFALTEAKVVLSYLVHTFSIEPSEKTLIPMKYSHVISLKPEGGMYLRLKKIAH